MSTDIGENGVLASKTTLRDRAIPPAIAGLAVGAVLSLILWAMILGTVFLT